MAVKAVKHKGYYIEEKRSKFGGNGNIEKKKKYTHKITSYKARLTGII